MKIVNIHSRIVDIPSEKLKSIFQKLGSKEDQFWPYENWPRMKFKNCLKLNVHGRHGPIAYYIKEYDPERKIIFEFTSPKGFDGFHSLEIEAIHENQSKIQHEIRMEAKGTAILKWSLGIKQLHDALVEDAFDKVENNFSGNKNVKTEWSFWVKFLRRVLG